MSKSFEERLYPILPDIIKHFGTPFHIYDELGIIETGTLLKEMFNRIKGFCEFFAVKANPNLTILRMMRAMGFGFDCSSPGELVDVRKIGAGPDDIMFTSNNTAYREYKEAEKDGGCILNLDDISFVEKVPKMPELVCFRYNPGERGREGTRFIGKPTKQKYGVPNERIVDAYTRAMARGAKRFGIHTMVVSNELDYTHMVDTVKLLLDAIRNVSDSLGIEFEFMNMGGGLGIPYKPDQEELPIQRMASEIWFALNQFEKERGYVPKLFMESGRYMTGPHGVLVTRVINRMTKYFEIAGVDACMAANPRPAFYETYHHITVPGREHKDRIPISVVGSLCENWDQFTVEGQTRDLPDLKDGDTVVIHDTGAHAPAMGGDYNARFKPQELMLLSDGSVKRVLRERRYGDYKATHYGAEVGEIFHPFTNH